METIIANVAFPLMFLLTIWAAKRQPHYKEQDIAYGYQGTEPIDQIIGLVVTLALSFAFYFAYAP